MCNMDRAGERKSLSFRNLSKHKNLKPNIITKEKQREAKNTNKALFEKKNGVHSSDLIVLLQRLWQPGP